jgi:hypothetical protein
MAHLRLVPQAVGQEEELRIFTVEWDPRQQKFVALDDNRMPLGASPNQSNAVSRAIQDARIACRSGSRIAVQVLQQNGRLRNEYIAQPPPRR